MYDKRNAPIVRAGFVIDPQLTCPIATGDAGLWHDSATGKATLHAADGRDRGLLRNEGVIPAARMAYSANPVNNDTITIGGHIYKFVTSLAAATTFAQVKVLGTAALSLAAAVHAINGVTDSNVVQASTPFTDSIVADAVSATVLRVRLADAKGGNAVPGVSSTLTLAASITAGAAAWSAANLNVSGKAATDSKMSFFQHAITAEEVTNASFQFELPFTPTAFSAFVTASTGVQRASTDAVTISGNAISVALAGGGSPAIQAGDLLRVWAIE
jgi:hypothetical protein